MSILKTYQKILPYFGKSDVFRQFRDDEIEEVTYTITLSTYNNDWYVNYHLDNYIKERDWLKTFEFTDYESACSKYDQLMKFINNLSAIDVDQLGPTE